MVGKMCHCLNCNLARMKISLSQLKSSLDDCSSETRINTRVASGCSFFYKFI